MDSPRCTHSASLLSTPGRRTGRSHRRWYRLLHHTAREAGRRETGAVDAYEIEPTIAQRATNNLAELSQVKVHYQSGVAGHSPNVMSST